ncbi:ABC transporter [Nocardioides humilatus]|uniref:ABC transporter n=1 Tax=Nocardioides humilatus TaxID=2607660 RepID=A0A5B1LGB4_9ACTN|nr:GTPase [Nocardioides humilatus]KAA1418820.1 ABC transporter [Nocardioides humilatus]
MTQTDGDARELRDIATRGTAIGARLQGLEKAVAAARGRLDETLLDETIATVERATGRLRLSAHHTVVAIAGATGSGKSSTFNALTGLELSSTGVRRPTTSWATACVWGSEGAAEVLDWLGIPPRHQTMRDSMLDTKRDDKALEGVVLMDLPDHDSTEVSHHLEVDRLVELADLLIWVVDPQKYADAALHDRYLAPYNTHAGVMLVVLNHIDTIAPEKRQGMVDDLKRLLAADGLSAVKVIPLSARHGIGVEELRQEVASRVEQKRSTTVRVEADVTAAVGRLERAGGDAAARELGTAQAQTLEERVAEAAGVPTIAAAVERTVRTRAARAIAWPPFAVVAGLGRRRSDDLLSGYHQGSPQAVAVQRASVDNGIRALADETAQGLAAPWASAVRDAATARLEETDDALDRGLSAVDLRADRVPGWVGVVRLLQWLLFLAALAGGGWWVFLVVQGTVDDAPEVSGVPLAAIVLGAGLALGLLLWLVFRPLVGGAARRRGDDADAELREVVTRVVGQQVVVPVNRVLASYSAFRAGLAQAQQ